MKFHRLFYSAVMCTAVSAVLAAQSVNAADGYKISVRGQAGQNQFESILNAELPDITGNGTYSVYLPVEQTKNIEYLVMEIEGLDKNTCADLTVVIDKVRIDGSEISLSGSPVIDFQCQDGDFSGTRIYIADENGSSFLPSKTAVTQSIEFIFTVSGMDRNGPEFVDKHAVQTESANPTDTEEPTDNPAVTTAPKTSGAELITRESTTEASETTAASSSSSSTVSSSTVSSSATTVSRRAGFGKSTTKRTGTAPTTGDKSVAIAFAGLAVTAAAAIASKFKRKKK